MFKSPRRNHFSVIFERLGAILAFFLVFAVNALKDYGWEIFTVSFYKNLLSTASENGLKSLIGFVVFTFFVLWCLFISYRYWLKTKFYIDGTDFIFERHTMYKLDSRLPVQNIAMVNVERNIFERLIGTAKVKIDLNSSRTASKTDFKFVLKKDDALALKDELLSLKASQASGVSDSQNADGAAPVESVPQEPRIPVVSFSVAEALRHKLLMFPIFQSLFSILLIFVIPYTAAGEGEDMSRMWFLLFIAVAGAIGSIVMGALNLGNYTIEHDSKVIYMSCGVINKKNYIFEREKINAVVIGEPLLARFFKLCSVSIAVVGLGNEKNETTHLSLMTDKATALDIINRCAPDFKCTGEIKKCHPVSLIFSLIRAIIFCAASLLTVFFFDYAVLLAVVVFVLLLIGGIIEYNSKFFASDENLVYYSRGIFNKSSGMVKYGDIQDVKIKTNLLCQRAGLGKMFFSILSASAMKEHRTGWFRISEFEKVAKNVVDTDEKNLLA